MNVIGHHYAGVQVELAKIAGSVMQAMEDHLGNVFALEPGGAEAGLIEIAIHPDEGVYSGGAWGREAVAGKTAVEAPGDEERCALRLPVRQMAGVEGHTHSWRRGGGILREL